MIYQQPAVLPFFGGFPQLPAMTPQRERDETRPARGVIDLVVRNAGPDRGVALAGSALRDQALEDLQRWQRKAVKKGADAPFESDYIPPAVMAFLRADLLAWDGETEPDEWVKRAAFATAAALAAQDKAAADEPFLRILELCRREAGDDRNYVKKAVNWALRNIGKRNLRLHAAAVATAEAILAEAETRAAADRRDPAARSGRWIARDALRELRRESTLERIRRRSP